VEICPVEGIPTYANPGETPQQLLEKYKILTAE
jgi:hypothetical protein